MYPLPDPSSAAIRRRFCRPQLNECRRPRRRCRRAEWYRFRLRWACYEGSGQRPWRDVVRRNSLLWQACVDWPAHHNLEHFSVPIPEPHHNPSNLVSAPLVSGMTVNGALSNNAACSSSPNMSSRYGIRSEFLAINEGRARKARRSTWRNRRPRTTHSLRPFSTRVL